MHLNTYIFSGFFLITILFSQSPEQIKKAKELVKNSSLSKSQIRNLAKNKGATDSQIDKVLNDDPSTVKDEGMLPLLKNTEDFTNESNETSGTKSIPDELESINNDFKYTDQSDLKSIEEADNIDDEKLKFESKNSSEDRSRKYFGYDIFKRDPSVFQASQVGAVDPNYLIGPGDELIVMLWGETQFRQVLSVDKEGFIFIPEIGQVFVNGLSLSLLETKLFRVLSQSYASLNPYNKKPTTFFDVSLGNLRPLRIQVLGEVVQPGSYTVSPSTTLFSSLYYFNGPTELGSLREIRLIRAGENIGSIDFYDFLLTGKKPNDHKLQIDDVIFIPKRLETVTISGEIKKPGIYEMKPEENLKDIIEIAGGLNNTAYLERVQIDRVVPFKDRSFLGMDRMFLDINLSELIESGKSFEIIDGDKINITSILDLRPNVVFLEGAVTRPGNYDLGDSLKLSKLILKADGLLGDAYLNRIDVVRTKEDFSQELIKLDLNLVLNENPEQDIHLKSFDRIIVYSKSEMISKNFVYISGNVKFPGRYPLQINMTLYDLLFQSDGFIDKEFIKTTYLERAELIRTGEDNNKKIIPFNLGDVLNKKEFAYTPLIPKDLVRVYSKTEIEGPISFVSITGHVKKPGQYELYSSNMKIYDLLFRAGGFSDPLFKSRSFLDKADLIRINEDQITKSIIPIDIGKILSDQNSNHNFRLKPGDELKVYSNELVLDQKYVTIMGSIKNPGSVRFKTGMTLKDLIVEAGGLSEDVFKYHVEIARIDPLKSHDEDYAELFYLDMDNDFSVVSDTEYNFSDNGSIIDIIRKGFYLMPYDKISIKPNPFFAMHKTVFLSGEFYYPGEYTIINPNERISDIFERAKGLRPNAFLEGAQFIRKDKFFKINLKKVLKKKKSNENLIVQDGDRIIVPQKPHMVELSGEINAPGVYPFKKSDKLKDYLKNAGGLTIDADKKNIYVSYPSGISKKLTWYSNPKILDGSKIVVGSLPESDPLDVTEYLKELTNIFANLAQVMSLIIITRSS